MFQLPHNNITVVKLVTLSLLVLVACQAKVFSKSFIPNDVQFNKGWIYLGRTIFQTNSTSIILQVKLNSRQLTPLSLVDIQILAIPAQLFKEQLQNKCDLAKYDRQSLQNKFRKQISFGSELSKSTLISSFNKTIKNKEPVTYHFILKDCMQSFAKQNLTYYSTVEINLEVTNSEQHFLANQFHNIWSIPLFIILSYLVLHVLDKDKDPAGNTWTKYILKASIWVGIISLIFKYIDHLLYAYVSGWHVDLLDALYLVMQSISDCAILFVILFVAFGWTISFNRHMDFDIWLPLSLFSSFSFIVIGLLNKSRDNWHSKFHVYDTFAGYIMIAIRVVLLTVFAYGIRRSINQLSSKDVELKKFFIQFAVFGVSYLLFLPFCMAVVEVFSQQNRHQCMNIVLELVRLLLNIWLAVLLGWKHSSYRKVLYDESIEKNKKN